MDVSGPLHTAMVSRQPGTSDCSTYTKPLSLSDRIKWPRRDAMRPLPCKHSYSFYCLGPEAALIHTGPMIKGTDCVGLLLH